MEIHHLYLGFTEHVQDTQGTFKRGQIQDHFPNFTEFFSLLLLSRDQKCVSSWTCGFLPPSFPWTFSFLISFVPGLLSFDFVPGSLLSGGPCGGRTPGQLSCEFGWGLGCCVPADLTPVDPLPSSTLEGRRTLPSPRCFPRVGLLCFPGNALDSSGCFFLGSL